MVKTPMLFNKTLVIVIFLLFIYIAIVPSINANISKKNVDFKLTDHKYHNPESDVEPLFWWTRWPDLPGRYEPMFEVHDIVELGQTTWGLSSADFNDDGNLDFAISYATSPITYSNISIFYNNGELGFNQDDVFKFYNKYINDLESGDYDLDGDIDLMFTYCNKAGSNDDGFVNLLFNDGENNFGNLTMIAELIVGDRINPQLTSDDFDNDGDIDFLVCDNSGLVEFYKNDGTGSFSSAGLYDFGGEMSWGISSADFDNDGDIDFIVTQEKDLQEGYIYLVWNDGSESCFNQSDFVKIADLPPQPSFFTGPIMGFGCLQSIDYNDDGKMDFIFSGSESVFLYMQQNIEVFNYFHIMRLPGRPDEEYGGWFNDDLRKGGIAIGDFNGDDLVDMVIGGVQGVVRLCYNNLVLVDIVHPSISAIYVNNKVADVPLTAPIMIYSFVKHGTSIVIGDLTVEAKGLVPLQKVEFYLGIKKIYMDDSEPFEWNWNSFSFGRHKVKAVAYDMNGVQAGFDDTIVWKFF